MKLASLKEAGRDGELVVVSRNLGRAVRAPASIPTLMHALENWQAAEPQLRTLADDLARAVADNSFVLSPAMLAAPLPRAAQWCDGSAYLHHAELVRRARNADMPEALYHDPLLYQGASDHFLAPTDPIQIANLDWGLDLEAELAVVVDDVPMGITPEDAAGHIKLVMLVNDVSLRNLIPAELAKGFGFFVSKPPTAFSPVAVTLDELGPSWDGTKLSLPLESRINGELLGQPNTGTDLYFDFPHLIAHAATSRPLCAGTIIGSGTVSNRDTTVGSSCLQEKRMLEKIALGEMRTPFLKYGDVVHIQMRDPDGDSIFGAIEQRVEPYAGV